MAKTSKVKEKKDGAPEKLPGLHFVRPADELEKVWEAVRAALRRGLMWEAPLSLSGALQL